MPLIPAPEFEFGPWATDDVVVGALTVPYLDGDEPADFTGSTVIGGWLYTPDGITTPVATTINATSPDTLDYALTGEPFDTAGMWAVAATVQAASGTTVRLASASFIVEDFTTGWLTTGEIRQTWADAPKSDVTLYRMLYTARLQVIEYARAVAVVQDPPNAAWQPPPNYVLAQGMQVRNVWNAAKTDPANQGIGDDGYIIRPYPMDWTVKRIIRPESAKPVVA